VKRILLYVLGMVAFAIGSKCFVDCRMGTDPLDVLLIGFSQTTGVLIGHAAIIATACFIGAYMWATRKLPHWTSFITAPLCGYALDFLNWQFPTGAGQPWLVFPALLLCSFGSAMILVSRYGIRIIDLLVIVLRDRTRIPFWAGKILVEILLFSGGLLLGGPFGIATLLFVTHVGPLVQVSVWLLHRTLGTPAKIEVT
jgi:hypothetical protein